MDLLVIDFNSMEFIKNEFNLHFMDQLQTHGLWGVGSELWVWVEGQSVKFPCFDTKIDLST